MIRDQLADIQDIYEKKELLENFPVVRVATGFYRKVLIGPGSEGACKIEAQGVIDAAPANCVWGR